ncbi:PAS domain-containing protein [Rhodohalobacter sp. 614A]|uniref:PAS domain-containing protein n=1 Tax=Rhodohalobacter sp. 614A TaxID=2908649 RepID=UPI001F48CFFA|nr:PAS domain S-box protein [Rhodohalobacter sp. 614A]
MRNFQEFLKSNSKDEESYKKLIEFVQGLVEERDNAKEQLDLLESAVRSDYDSVLITTLELDKPGPKIVYVNDGFTRMTGYTKEEVIGKTPRILQGPKTDRKVLDTLKKRLREGQSFFGHTVNYRKDGTEFIIQWDIHPLTNEEGEVTHWVSYQHDITERKRSERKVMDSQIEFDSLDEESKKTLIDIDEQGNIITSNKAFRDLIGYDDEELKKSKIWDLLADEQVETFKHKFDQFKPSDFEGAVYELNIVNKKGNSVEVQVRTRLLEIDDQKVVRTSFENKSLQKRIMAMLNKRNESYRKMYDSTKDFRYKLVQTSGGDFVFDYVSDSFIKITGVSAKQAEGTPIGDFVHKDDIEKVEAHLKNILQGKPNTEQYRIKRKDGSYSEVIDYAKPVWDVENANVEAVKGSISTQISSAKKTTKN